MKCLTFEIFTHKTPNPRWGGVGLIFVYYFSLQFMTFPGLLIFEISQTSRMGWGGGLKKYRFSRQFMKCLTFEIFTHKTPSSWHFPDFWFLKSAKSVGWGGGGGLKKYRFSRQFMKCLTFEIFTHKTPNPRWGGVGLIFVYYFSLQFFYPSPGWDGLKKKKL